MTQSMPSTLALPVRGHDERRDHPQRRRLARAVGAEERGDRAVGRAKVKRHAPPATAPKCFARVSTSDQGPRYRRGDSTKSGRGMRSRHLPSRPPRRALRTNDSTRRGAQPCRLTPCASCAARRSGARSAASRPPALPWRGGVAGSMPPERISTGTLAPHRIVVVGRHLALAATSGRRCMKSSTSARPKNELDELPPGPRR